MKTTIELEDDLFFEVKVVAARRRTTLRAVIEHALRREISEMVSSAVDGPAGLERNALGFFVLPKEEGGMVTTETIREIQVRMDDEELREALNRTGER